MQKMNSLRPQDTTSAERQTSWVMFVCLYVELIPSSDKPRNISFFIISWTRWLIGLQSQMKHCWVRLKCEIGQTSVAQWMGSRVTVSTWIHLHPVPSRRRNSEEKSVLPFSNFLLLSDQRSQLAGKTPERSHSWVWTVTVKQLLIIARSLTTHTNASPRLPQALCHWLFWFYDWLCFF